MLMEKLDVLRPPLGHIITNTMFTALLLMAIASTMSTVPIVTPLLERMKILIGLPA